MGQRVSPLVFCGCTGCPRSNIGNASKAFGALRQAVFKDKHLTVATKRRIYNACMLTVLLYSSECWAPLRRDLKKLNRFHHRCVCTVLGITSQRQWEKHIMSTAVREQWGRHRKINNRNETDETSSGVAWTCCLDAGL